MQKWEHLREIVTGQLEPDRVKQRTEMGWRLVALEWQRPTEEGIGEEVKTGESSGVSPEEVPFGMQVADDCFHLVENPREREILVLMMDLIVQDHPLSHVARELNLRGFRTRSGGLWGQVSVFNMLPRLVEAGPRIFSSRDWETRRNRLASVRHAN